MLFLQPSSRPSVGSYFRLTLVPIIGAVAAAVVLGCLGGCGPFPQPQIIPAHYNVRETDNGVFIFEYDAGNQGQNSGDSLTLFTDSLNTWTKEHPELTTTRLERLSTTVSYRDTQNQSRSVTVVNVLVYTTPSGKAKSPPPKSDQPPAKTQEGGAK